MASPLAGNFILIGYVANFIVAQRSRQRGVTIGLRPSFAMDVPLKASSIGFGALWLG